ncbi:MAG: lipoyl synthase, partial [Gammaproteobacteria bacterium]|nr:lipoyl synthase [Gammaproteobacteria bacterium]
IAQTRALAPGIQIEILTPDFRGRVAEAVEILVTQPPDVFNHNLETVPRLYKSVRPGADYAHSLGLIQTVKQRLPTVPTKSGLMLGVGETLDEVAQTMRDLRAHGCDMLTLGQYLQPTRHHLPVVEYLQPQVFTDLARLGEDMGFKNVASGPMVRSSYHADLQAAGRLTPQE